MIEKIEQLLSQSRELNFGREQVSVLEEAVKLADAENHESLQFESRELLIRAGIFGGQADKSLTAFAWCVQLCDQKPESFQIHDLFWKYKWVIGNSTEFPTIPKSKIYALVDDFESRLIQHGYSNRAAIYRRWDVAVDMYDMDVAISSYQDFEHLPRDIWADCRACELDQQIYKPNISDEEIVKIGYEVINGEYSCNSVPEVTYSKMLEPLTHLGREKEADECFENCIRMSNKNGERLATHGTLLQYAAYRNWFDKGVQIIEEYLKVAIVSRELDSAVNFMRGLFLFFSRAAKSKNVAQLRINLPRDFDRYDGTGLYDSAELAAYFREKTENLDAQFDARNGNRAY